MTQVVYAEPQKAPNPFAEMAPGEGYQLIQEFGLQDSSVGIEDRDFGSHNPSTYSSRRPKIG
jgi:hypothetical protein